MFENIYNITDETADEVINEIIAWENSQENEEEITFSMDEVLEMIDEALRIVKGGDDLPAVGTEEWENYMEYSSGISYCKGSVEAQMYHKMGYEYDYKKDAWIKA